MDVTGGPLDSSCLSRIPHGLSHGFLVNSLTPQTSFYMRGMILQVCWNPTKRHWKPEKFVISSTKPWKVRSFSRWTTPFSAAIFRFPKNWVKYTQSIPPLIPFKPPSMDDFPSIYLYIYIPVIIFRDDFHWWFSVMIFIDDFHWCSHL